MTFGLVSVSFRGHSPEEIIRETKKAGLSCIEWGSDVHAPKNDIERLRSIAKMQKEEGIFCSSYGTYFRIGINDTSELYEYINAAKILSTDILRVWCGNKASEEYSPEEKDLLIEECRRVAEIAEKNNVTVCLECHNNTFTDTKETAILLMKLINSPSFRMYWQPNQFTSEEEKCAYARLISSFTKVIHVFNWTENERFPLKEARDKWEKYLSYFNGDKILLLEFMPDDSISSLTEEAKALREIADKG